MSADDNGDDDDDIHIAALFVFYAEGQQLLLLAINDYRLEIRLSAVLMNPRFLLDELLHNQCCWREPALLKVSIKMRFLYNDEY